VKEEGEGVPILGIVRDIAKCALENVEEGGRLLTFEVIRHKLGITRQKKREEKEENEEKRQDDGRGGRDKRERERDI